MNNEINKKSGDFDDEASKILEEREKTNLKDYYKDNNDTSNNQPHIATDIGWINLDVEYLPSKGLFYPENTKILIKAASVPEIRQWSTIDERDFIKTSDVMDRMVEKHTKLIIDNKQYSYKDIKEIDRLYIIFAIRELTFKHGENNLYIDYICDSCQYQSHVLMKKETLNYFQIPENLVKYYSSDLKCFNHQLSNNEEVSLYIPSIGVMYFIKDMIRKYQTGIEKINIDEAFLKWAPFVFADWRNLNPTTYKKLQMEIDTKPWSLEKISFIDWFIDELQISTTLDLKMICENCGSEVTTPLSFPRGIKSIFLISNIDR